MDAVVHNQLVEQQLIRADQLEGVSRSYTQEFKDAAFPGQLFYPEDIYRRTLGVYAGLSQPDRIPDVWVMHCCTSNATQGLYYAWEGALRETGTSAEINLLINRTSRLLDIDSYLPYEGKVVIHNKAARQIAIRIPAWVRRDGVGLELSGKPLDPAWVANRILLTDLTPGADVTLTFPIHTATYSYTINAHTGQEQVYTCTFRGSTLVDISPRDHAPTSYPLYQRDTLKAGTVPFKTIERFVPAQIVRQW